MADRDLLQGLYLASGVVLVMGYGPQLRRLLLHPEAGATACPMSSWLLWTACRVVALAYSACAVRDAALTLIVSLDVAGRAAVLALLVRVHWIRRRRRRPRAAPWPAAWGALALLASTPLLLGCRQPQTGPPARTATNPQQASQVSQARLAWLRRHVLNLVLLPLLDDGEPQRWIEPRQAFDCLGPLAVRVDGRPLEDGAAVPSTPFVLEWRGEQCALAWGGVLPLSGRITLQVRRSATAIAAFVEPDDIVLPVDGIPLRLHDAFATAVDVGPMDGP